MSTLNLPSDYLRREHLRTQILERISYERTHEYGIYLEQKRGYDQWTALELIQRKIKLERVHDAMMKLHVEDRWREVTHEMKALEREYEDVRKYLVTPQGRAKIRPIMGGSYV